MDIGCNINDAALLRNLAEDVPDMAASVRRRLRELADLIEAREASARPEVPALHEGMREVPCAVRDDGWLYIPHADGKWVTAAKLQPFSLAIIQHWKAEQGAIWTRCTQCGQRWADDDPKSPFRTHGVAPSQAPKRHALCGKCMTPHICAEDGPGCAPAAGVKTPDGAQQ